MENINKLELEFIEKVKAHTLGDKEEAMALYMQFVDLLKDKYGELEKDYDENPRRRGTEWIDIHHVMEYEKDDIARRTKSVKAITKAIANNNDEFYCIALTSEEYNNEEYRESVMNSCKAKSVAVVVVDDTLEELKPYNVKEKLVYANKIEHFLLHYLIASMRGKQTFSGGVNYLWDNCIALDAYGFYAPYMNRLQENKDFYYSLMTSEDISKMYRKMIDWGKWDIGRCELYWQTFKNTRRKLEKPGVSNVKDVDKLLSLFNIIKFSVSDVMEYEMRNMPYKYRTYKNSEGQVVMVIDKNHYLTDKETMVAFMDSIWKERLRIPSRAKKISRRALFYICGCKELIIPTTVEEIDDQCFWLKCPNGSERKLEIERVEYKGTREEWNAKFPNVVIKDIDLVCRKSRKKSL